MHQGVLVGQCRRGQELHPCRKVGMRPSRLRQVRLKPDIAENRIGLELSRQRWIRGRGGMNSPKHHGHRGGESYVHNAVP
jgi:hypothetical protein